MRTHRREAKASSPARRWRDQIDIVAGVIQLQLDVLNPLPASKLPCPRAGRAAYHWSPRGHHVGSGK